MTNYQHSKAVLDVHEQVRQLVDYRIAKTGPLMFFTADTGLGKSTGFRKAIGTAVWGNGYNDHKILILVPNIKLADDCYVELNEMYQGRIGIWTSDHDTSTLAPQQNPSVRMTKEEAAKMDCLIICHASSKDAEKWVGHRDLVFYDEDPEITHATTITLADFALALQEEKAQTEGKPTFRSVYLEQAKDWAESQSVSQSLSEIEIPKWVSELAGFERMDSSEGARIRDLAVAITKGLAFMNSHTRTQWTHYKLDVPYADRAIVFSATAQYVGYHLSDKIGDINNSGLRVDYSTCTFKHKPWPKGITIMQNDIMSNRGVRAKFFIEVMEWVQSEGGADDKTLFICPKKFKTDIEHLYPKAQYCTYGQGIGSNRFMGTTKVFVVGEFHKPLDSYRSTFLSYSGVQAKQEHLDKLKNNSKALREVSKNHLYVHLKQMVSRSALRLIDDEGKAKPVTVHCMMDEDRFIAGVPELFDKAVTLHSPIDTTSATNNPKVSWMSKLMKHLSEADGDTVTFSDLNEVGISTHKRASMIMDNEDQLLRAGWDFVVGTGRGNPSILYRR